VEVGVTGKKTKNGPTRRGNPVYWSSPKAPKVSEGRDHERAVHPVEQEEKGV